MTATDDRPSWNAIGVVAAILIALLTAIAGGFWVLLDATERRLNDRLDRMEERIDGRFDEVLAVIERRMPASGSAPAKPLASPSGDSVSDCTADSVLPD